MSAEIIFGSRKPNVKYVERPAAYLIVVENGKYAAVKPRQKYFLPGGGSLANETAEQTVIREVFEELGRTARPLRKLAEVVQYFYSASDQCFYKMRAAFFVGEFTSESRGGENELFWLSKEEAKNGFFHECHKWAIRQI